MKYSPIFFTCVALVAMPLSAAEKLMPEDRVEILRGLTAEFGTVKAFLPRSKKPLAFHHDGTYDKKQWEEVGREMGPCARVGDLVQVTKVEIENDRILLEINGGVKSGRKWYERVEVGVGTRTSPVGQGGTPTAGTNIALVFPKGVPPLEAKEFKKMLAPILDFEKRSVTENYIESLPPPIQAAIKEKRALEGMDRDQVVLALGKPRNKMRETKDGAELEDWVYGLPPGKITFVTFENNKVIKVKDAYAGLGGSIAEPLKPQ
jgi:hypothetical protein